MKLKKGIIAHLARYPLGRSLAEWLGRPACDERIGLSGLWNTRQLDTEPLNVELLE